MVICNVMGHSDVGNVAPEWMSRDWCFYSVKTPAVAISEQLHQTSRLQTGNKIIDRCFRKSSERWSMPQEMEKNSNCWKQRMEWFNNQRQSLWMFSTVWEDRFQPRCYGLMVSTLLNLVKSSLGNWIYYGHPCIRIFRLHVAFMTVIERYLANLNFLKVRRGSACPIHPIAPLRLDWICFPSYRWYNNVCHACTYVRSSNVVVISRTFRSFSHPARVRFRFVGHYYQLFILFILFIYSPNMHLILVTIID